MRSLGYNGAIGLTMGNSPKRILLVEDHVDTRNVTALMLRRSGYFVSTAATQQEALKICEKEDFDVLLGDVGLPDGSGLDLMRELRSKCNIKGIAYTGYGYEKDIASARAAGFSAYLLKPVNLDTLLRTVERVVGESTDPTVTP